MMNPRVETNEILYEVSGGIATVTLNRPAKLNAATDRMLEELRAAFDESDADDRVRAVVITGADRAFCSGVDISRGVAAFSPQDRVQRREGTLSPITLRIFEARKPTIAAVNGLALGLGASMILAADLRLASSAARFGFVFTRRGIVPDSCSSWFLPRVVGIGRAMEWVVTGRTVDAVEALGAGLVRSVHEPDDLLPAAYRIGEEIVRNTSPVSVALARQMLWRMLGAAHPRVATEVERPALEWRSTSADVQEAIMALTEKRAPRFEDRVSDGWPDFFASPLPVPAD